MQKRLVGPYHPKFRGGVYVEQSSYYEYMSDVFIQLTDPFFPTTRMPNMQEVEEQFEFYCQLRSAGEHEYAKCIQKECIKKEFDGNWIQAFSTYFERRPDSGLTNVDFYIAKGNGLEGCETRLCNLQYMADWFKNARDSRGVLEFVYWIN